MARLTTDDINAIRAAINQCDRPVIDALMEHFADMDDEVLTEATTIATSLLHDAPHDVRHWWGDACDLCFEPPLL